MIPTTLTDRQISNLKNKFSPKDTFTFVSGTFYEKNRKEEELNIYDVLDGDNMARKIQIWREARSQKRFSQRQAKKTRENAFQPKQSSFKCTLCRQKGTRVILQKVFCNNCNPRDAWGI